ncbi:MAG: TetR/AcrR family transcriptional regulator [Actinomycetota bacterium]
MARIKARSDEVGEPGPVAPTRRRQTESQQRNAELLLDAMVIETDSHGLDYLRSARVAQAVGLTTGALYSRYENADEMLVALWQERVSEPYLAHIRDVVRYVQGELPRQHQVTQQVLNPSPLLRLGAEFTVVATRNDTIGEVVIPALEQALVELGLRADADPLKGAVVMIAASAAVGTALRSFVTGTNPGWDGALASLRLAAETSAPLQHSPLNDDQPPLPINTGNPVRDALLTSAKRVVARVGFKNATITRIARRAGFSTSAIYQLWTDKEAMLDEAIHEVSVLGISTSAQSKEAAALANRADFGLADSWAYWLMPSRRARNDFRLECVIAARHHATTRNELRRIFEQSDAILQATFPQLPHSVTATLATTEQALGFGFTALHKFVPSARQLDYFSVMAALAKLGPLA